MKLIKGSKLSDQQRRQVLSAFVYRWTADNPMRERAWAHHERPRIPLISDDEWLKRYQFYFTSTDRLSVKKRYAEPILPPPPPPILGSTMAGAYTMKCLAE